MRLFWSRLSPFVRKVMVVAHEAGVADRIELEDTLVAMSEINGRVLALNPLGQIPTLVLDDGDSLHDSRVICEYLDGLRKGERLVPPSGPARWEALTRAALGDGLLDVLILWRQERLKPAERQTGAWLETFAAKTAAVLDRLEARAPAFGILPFDIGHVAVGCALGYLDFRFGDLDWRAGRPALAAWHLTFEARPSAIATHPGEPA